MILKLYFSCCRDSFFSSYLFMALHANIFMQQDLFLPINFFKRKLFLEQNSLFNACWAMMLVSCHHFNFLMHVSTTQFLTLFMFIYGWILRYSLKHFLGYLRLFFSMSKKIVICFVIAFLFHSEAPYSNYSATNCSRLEHNFFSSNLFLEIHAHIFWNNISISTWNFQVKTFRNTKV